ncbi:MAG: enoyl-CoA hydratase/isomerase family protein [Actinobacteria bacterium]|nr:enoyl-CoA hydratase/isomerase family protein [Actinomycetota bacterium]NIS32023.1 enoyl-CoA hydratase/isomerase family protein [Actinomycetota bacterium]NIT97939.1 enoyl-CoA hydratase/isomerase family protein [Actinomycetota bacterium]NIU21583.1 enoyl-CoA hydratase/isomerase family protein [Actinomycetota bacterium]NIU69842.1 enoyl-CoA hydratase/isomerase family protein [Actinomycetota bacterium]
MTAPTMRRDGELVVIDFGDGENRTDPEWVSTMGRLLDEAEGFEGPQVLVTTASGRHYSNGLDVDHMAGLSSPAEITEYVAAVEGVLSRLLTFPAPTVAAVNGHAFGAGAFAILAHDHAVMREDRGFVCWPEVHLQMTFSPGLLAMVKDLLPTRTSREAVLTGRRYSGPDAVAAGFVDRAVPLDELASAAAELGLPHAPTAGSNLGTVKRQFHRRVVELLGPRSA